MRLFAQHYANPGLIRLFQQYAADPTQNTLLEFSWQSCRTISEGNTIFNDPRDRWLADFVRHLQELWESVKVKYANHYSLFLFHKDHHRPCVQSPKGHPAALTPASFRSRLRRKRLRGMPE